MKRGITSWCGTVPLISTTVSSLLLFTKIITDLFWGNLSPDKCCTMFRFGYWSSGANSPPGLTLLCALQGTVQAEPLLLSCSWTAGAVFCPERLSQYHEDRSIKPLRFVICPCSEVLPPSAVEERMTVGLGLSGWGGDSRGWTQWFMMRLSRVQRGRRTSRSDGVSPALVRTFKGSFQSMHVC